MAGKPTTKFMKIKDSWPVFSVSNSRFTVSKTEPCPIPEGFTPDTNMFDVFESPHEAYAATRKEARLIETRRDEGGKGITRRDSIPGLTGVKPKVEPAKALEEPQDEFHGLRKTTDVKTGKTGFMLATKDLPRFLNREALLIVRELDKLDENTLTRIMGLESSGMNRRAVVAAIESLLKIEPIIEEEAIEIPEDKQDKKPKKAEGKAGVKKPSPKSDLKRLLNIKGIGHKTLEDIKRIYPNVDSLRKGLIENSVPLRDDVVKLLKEVLL